MTETTTSNFLDISIIIPAYNEEDRILLTLERIYNYLNEGAYTWEIIVALDGGTDATQAIVEAFSKLHPQVTLIPRTQNRGKGYTVREGMQKAKGAICLFTDADNSTDISHIEKMLPCFEEGADVVICSRNHRDHPDAAYVIKQRIYKRILGTLGNLFIQTVAVPSIWDTQCGFKAFTHNAAGSIFSRAQIDRWGFDIEILAIARNLKYSLQIVPASWSNNDQSKVKILDYGKVLLEAVQVRINLLKGRYR